MEVIFPVGDATRPPEYGSGVPITGDVVVRDMKDVNLVEASVSSSSLPENARRQGTDLTLFLISLNNIIIKLVGRLYITLTSQGLPLDKSKMEFLDSTRTMYSQDDQKSPELPNFSFDIPMTFPSTNVLLPPSWHIRNNEAEAQIVYQAGILSLLTVSEKAYPPQVRVRITRRSLGFRKSEEWVS
jgi:hypothetical protein